ncbi:hypothetical protein ACHAXT_003543 [Thalassiosira profunda]
MVRLLALALVALASSPGTAFEASSIISILPWTACAAAWASTSRLRHLASANLGAPSSTSLAIAMSSASTNGEIPQIKRIGIIGGGAAGLAAARAFLRANQSAEQQGAKTKVQFDVTVLESRNSIGGVWKYDDEEASIKSRPMYRNLRTNLPKELMAFREFPWGGDGREASYVTHQTVQRYLEAYAKEFGLLESIKFGCKVDHLKVLSNESDGDNEKKDDGEDGCGSWPQISLQWTGSDNNQHEATFDNVCVCNGHYALPSNPPLKGLDNFSGRVIHAIEYDDPNEFASQTVLCVGARASGADIAREVGLVADRVYLSDSTCEKMQEFGNVVLMPKTQSIDAEGKVHFASSTEEQMASNVDVIIFCSGYDYSFPFIDAESNLDLEFMPGERRVWPLYEQMWHARYPSLAFVGLPHSVVPFPLFELQSAAILSQLSAKDGSIPLPSLEERLAAAESDAKAGGPVPPGRVQDTHFLGSHQWEYSRKLAKIAGTYDEAMENYIATNKAIYDRSGKERKGMAPGGEDLYRETRFRRVDGKQTYEILHSELEPKTAV